MMERMRRGLRTLRKADRKKDESNPPPPWYADRNEISRVVNAGLNARNHGSSPESARHDFANLVVRQLTAPSARVAVIDDGGKPALVRCNELLFDLLSKDHPIVGVYAPGATVRDLIDDLKAAGL